MSQASGIKREREADNPASPPDDVIPVKKPRTAAPSFPPPQGPPPPPPPPPLQPPSPPRLPSQAKRDSPTWKKEVQQEQEEEHKHPMKECFIRIRGMPYQATKRDVMDFFEGQIKFSSEFIPLMKTFNLVKSTGKPFQLEKLKNLTFC
jgi:hypothetical protein